LTKIIIIVIIIIIIFIKYRFYFFLYNNEASLLRFYNKIVCPKQHIYMVKITFYL